MKLNSLSYEEMKELSSEGAKVLHNRCVEVGEKFKIPIITKSTFNNKDGTLISDIIEENTIKSMVKSKISRISIVGNGIIRNPEILSNVFTIIAKHLPDILDIYISEYKITINSKNTNNNKLIDELHNVLIENKL